MADHQKSSNPPNTETHNLLVAQILADLNQLQLATDQRAALSLLEINDSLSPDRRQSTTKTTLPTPENVFSPPQQVRNKRSTSGLQRLNTGPGTSSRPGATPLLNRGISNISSTSESSSFISGTGTTTWTLGGTRDSSDADLQRAQTLLALYSSRESFLKPSYSSKLEGSRQTIAEIAAKYRVRRDEEMGRDGEGMRRALEEVGLGA